MKSVPGITDKITAAVTNATKTAHADSFQIVFLASIAFGGCAIVAAFLCVPVDQHLDDVVAAKLHGSGASEETLYSEKVEPAH